MNANVDDDLNENYAWADERLEQLYLENQDHREADSLLDDEDIEDNEDDEEEMDNIHLNAYDQGEEGDHDFRIICRRLFPDDDDIEETEADILSEMSVDFDLYYEGNEGEALAPQVRLMQELPEGPPLVRANTQFQLNGVTIINGNPDGSRLFEDDYDDWQPIT